jgi:hypothetical protein
LVQFNPIRRKSIEVHFKLVKRKSVSSIK